MCFFLFSRPIVVNIYSDQDEFELQCNFISLARELPGFGDTFFNARDPHGKDLLLAISKLSITFYVDGKLEERFAIDRIRRWMALPEKQSSPTHSLIKRNLSD